MILVIGKPGGKCLPLLEEEKQLQSEVSWGTIRTRSNNSEVRSYEFLTSNYGSQLPVYNPIQIRQAYPDIQGCSPLLIPTNHIINDIVVDPIASGLDINHPHNPNHSYYERKAVIVNRGGCRFDIKALHAQEVGADLLIIVDIEDNALQRVGGKNPEAGYVGIPSIIVTMIAGKYIYSIIDNNNHDLNATPTLEIIPSRNSNGSDLWIELAITEWAEDAKELIMQIEGLIQRYSQSESFEIVAWLNRKLHRLVNANKKSIDTDGF